MTSSVMPTEGAALPKVWLWPWDTMTYVIVWLPIPTDVYSPQKINQVLSQINRVRVVKIPRHEAEKHDHVNGSYSCLRPKTDQQQGFPCEWPEVRTTALVCRDWCHAAPKIESQDSEVPIFTLSTVSCTYHYRFLMEVSSRFLTLLPGALPSALSPALFPVTEISTLPQLPPWPSRFHPQPDSQSL